MSDESFDLRTGWQALRDWLGGERGWRLLILLVLAGGAYLRLSHLDWDMGTHIHPDERFLTMVEDAMKLPKSLGEFFDSTKSTMSPYNTGYGFFVYGTLPIFIVRVLAEVANKLNQAARLWTSGPGGSPLDLVGYSGVHLVGRSLSGLFDLAGMWLIYVIGRRLYSRRAGLLAAALLAFAVLPLQQSHFFTVDTFGTFFSLLTFYLAVRVAQGGEPGRRGGGWRSYLALGASLGASVASRINLAPLAGIALLAAGIRAWDDWHREGGRDGAYLSTLIQATLFRLLLMGLVTVAVIRTAQPYAFGGTTLLDFSLSPKWQDNMKQISAMMSGAADIPPGHQWTSRTPFIFPFVNMVVWGMGLPLGLTAWAGWALASSQIVLSLTKRAYRRIARAHLLPVVWIGGMFFWQGLQFVQSMRYLLPIYPLLALMAAWLLWWLVDRARDWTLKTATGDQESGPDASVQISTRQRLSRRAVPAAYALMAFVVVGTMVWGWSFLAIYRRPLSRVTASRWMYENVPPGSHIGNEHWDDGLPLRIDDKDAYGSYGLKGLSSSSDGNMQMYWEDTPEKREQLYQWLNEADYLVLSSNRLWGSIPRLPMRYPMTTLYYKLLFEGKLGFKQVLHTTSFPSILGIQFNDTGAEEAFSVYDHPEVYIFQKSPEYSESLVRSYLDKVDLENVIQMWPKQISAAPTALMLTAAEAARQEEGGTWSSIFSLGSVINQSPVVSTLLWLLLLEVLGVIGFIYSSVVLRSLSDRGYGVGKILGVLLLAWLSWLGPSLKILPFERWLILLVLVLLAAGAGAIGWRQRTTLVAFVRAHRSLLLTEEVLFLVLFALFLLIRIGNPDLWHPARGGEKPMDFAFLNAVIKSTTFPPYDPWHSGGFMNYYYFGFVVIGSLIKLLGIVPWVAYNLVVPTLFAMTGLGAFSVAYSLTTGDTAATAAEEGEDGEEAAGPEGNGEAAGSSASARIPPSVSGLFAGLAATFFVAIVGNFGNVKLILDQLALRSSLQMQSSIPGFAKLLRALSGGLAVLSGKPLDFPNDWWFWNASRVIPDTINEFPFFTFTYADLHAHMIALPLTLLGLATALSLVRLCSAGLLAPGCAEDSEPSPWRISLAELLLIALFGLVLGALRATNTWDFPTYALVGLAAIAVSEGSRRSRVPFPAQPDERLEFLLRSVVAVIWRTLILLLVATIAWYPYTKYFATAYAGLQPWKDATTKIGDYLTVWGFFLVLIGIYLLSELRIQLRERRTQSWVATAMPIIIAAVGVVLVGGILLFKAQIWLIAVPLAVLALILALGRDLPPSRRLALLLIALALAITMGVEIVRQRDDIGRMNTVFKFYFQVWTLMGVTAAFGLARWVERARSWTPGWRRFAFGMAAVLFIGVMLYPPLAARAKVRDRFSAEDSPRGLDGIAFMDNARYFDNNMDLHLADDKAAILWMLQNVPGSPVILEGSTQNYRWGSRFSIYTGLPAVQGWDWHEKQQRSIVPGTEIDRRLSQVNEMYSTTDLPRAQKLLDHYGVSYIIVGDLERAYYPAEGLAKFDALVSQDYLKLAYQGGAVKIYQVVGRGKPVEGLIDSPIGPQPVPTPTPGEGELGTKPFASPVQ